MSRMTVRSQSVRRSEITDQRRVAWPPSERGPGSRSIGAAAKEVLLFRFSMVEQIILLSGPVASSKSTLSRGLSDRFGIIAINTRVLLRGRLTRNDEPDRRDLQAAGDELDERTDGRWVRDELESRLRRIPEESTVLVDSTRRLNQINAIREKYGPIVAHIHLTAPLVLQRRIIWQGDF